MTITRRRTLGLLGAAAVTTGCPTVFASPKKHYDLKPVKVADGLWMVEGSTDYFTTENGGAIVNCAIVETDTGAVLLDTGPSLRYGQALRKVATEISTNGIAATINTHHHPDHFFGNQAFVDRPIHALGETISLAKSEGDAFSDNMYRLLGDWMRGTEVVPPTHTLDSSSITIGGRRMRVLPLSGHTGSDLALIDERTGTLITGDLAFLDRAPTTPHADIPLWLQSLEVLKDLQVTGIVPGHGPFDSSGESLTQTEDYLGWLDKVLRAAASDGYDMVEVMEFEIPARFASMGAMPTEFERSVSHLFPEIERAVMPLKN